LFLLLVKCHEISILFDERLCVGGENVDDGSGLDRGGQYGVIVVVFFAISADMFVSHGGIL